MSPASGVHPPPILIAVWALLLAMLAGRGLYDAGFFVAGFALFCVAAILILLGSVVYIITLIARKTFHRST